MYDSIIERLSDMLAAPGAHYEHMVASATDWATINLGAWQALKAARLVLSLPHDEGYAWRIVKVFAKRGANAYGVWAEDKYGDRLFIRIV